MTKITEMKIKNIFVGLLMVLFFSQCHDALDENYYSGTTVETLLETQDGAETLVTACYVSAKMWYGKEYGWDLTTAGTDVWTYAADAGAMIPVETYSSSFNNSYPGRFAVIWAEFYKALNACNTVISYLPEAGLDDEDWVNTRMGEVYFLRAFYLWHIVETWGEVYLSTEPITEPSYELTRSSLEEFYTQIFSDLDSAVALLPETLDNDDYGRIYKYAALAFRSRANLYWAQEYMSGNCYNGTTYSAIGGRDHLAQAISDAQDVIDNGGFELYDKYKQVWLMDNNASANVNTENIWAVNYSNTEYAITNIDPDEFENLTSNSGDKKFSEREGGNDGHMMFGMRWFAVYTASGVMVKDDGVDGCYTEPTRPFCRYMPTKFMIDLYDETVDQRWAGTFNNIFYSNKTEDNGDGVAWPEYETEEELGNGEWEDIDASLVGTQVLEYGDTAFYMFKDSIVPLDQFYVKKDYCFHKKGKYFFLDMDKMYNDDGSVNDDYTVGRYAFFDLCKWYDSTRAHNGANQDVTGSQRGKKDFIVLRLPEMYYILAEAYLANGNQSSAYDALLAIADKRAIGGDGAALLAAYGINSASDVDVDFILDDRARELAGEQQRWFDLKRTGKTLERIQAHNPDATSIAEKHLVRPIPQVELDAIQNSEDFESGWGIY